MNSKQCVMFDLIYGSSPLIFGVFRVRTLPLKAPQGPSARLGVNQMFAKLCCCASVEIDFQAAEEPLPPSFNQT